MQQCARRQRVAGAGKGRPLGELQRLLLQRTRPEAGALQAAWSCRPAGAVGGDLVAVTAPGPDRLFVFVADAMGHGPAAAVVASALRAALHLSQQAGVWSPGEVLNRLGALLGELFAEHFATAAACLLDAGAGRLTCALAGHPALLLRQPDGVVQRLAQPALPLGLAEGVRYEERCLPLEVGSVLLLYTDGIADALAAGSAAQLRTLTALLSRSGSANPRRLVRVVAATAERRQPRPTDDRTVLAACRQGD
jgi:serine phosphatase RsbU (regulator of sigma subunit)